MKSNRVTLRDIAERAGISRTAVSLALKNHPSISRSTIERVRKIADELGFIPDPEVSKLMAHLRVKHPASYQSTIAWLTAWDTENGWNFWLREKRIFAGATERAKELGYLLEPFWLRAPGMAGRRAATVLQARGIESVIVAPLPDGAHTLDFGWESFAVTAVGHSLENPELHRVESAHARNFEMALAEIRRRKITRIGFIESTGTDERVAHAWTGAFLTDQQVQPEKNRVPLLIKPEIAQADFNEWFKRHRPEVIVSNECPIVNWVRALGLDVPSDVGHVRLDCGGPELLGRYEWGFSGTWPSGIDQMPEQVGATAVDTVVSQMHLHERGIPAYPKTILVRGRWREHATLSPLAGGRRAAKRPLNVK